MSHPVPHISELGQIRMPGNYRDDPALIKAYLTGFMNAWNHAHALSVNGPDTRTIEERINDF